MQKLSFEDAVKGLLSKGEMAGKALRQALRGMGIKLTGPGFYLKMSHLRNANVVDGWYKRSRVGGTPIKEMWFKLKAP